MRTAVVHIKRPEEAAKVAKVLDADVLDYSEDVFEEMFDERKVIVAIMACGIVVRKISPLMKDKWSDPAVVVVSPDLRFAIPIAGGHHGGNETAKKLASIGVEPVITTATDALGKDSVEDIARRHGGSVVNTSSTVKVNASFLQGDVPVYRIAGPSVVLIDGGVSVIAGHGDHVVGIGCNRGTDADEIVQAVDASLLSKGLGRSDVLAYATTVKKYDEKGITDAARTLGGPLFFIDDDTINRQDVASRSKAAAIGLIGVAEPAALALAKRKELILERRAYGNVTVAIAR
ncbi:MAG: cobalt-precorrin 5A hydrolase [Methanomassiliicoccales archaeon]|nr:MAG: cobalt-precorrin 5A hydrolase [Methanomassiliicoccales archaeon]